MAFNFGAGLAKAAGGAAEIAGNEIKNEQTLDLQRELSDIQNAKALALEQATYDRSEQRKDAEFAKVKSITDSVTDPMEGKGGYESPAEQAKRQYGLLEQKAAALRDAGKYDAADKLDKELNRIDSKTSKEGQLEIKKLMLDLQGQRIEDLGKYQQGLLNNAAERVKLQGEVNDAKAAKGDKKTDADKQYDSYVEQIKAQKKTPMARYQFDNWMETKKAKDNSSETTSTKSMDAEGNEVTHTVKGKPNSNNQATPKIIPWNTYFNS